MAKWKRWGLQNLDARVRFSSAPPNNSSLTKLDIFLTVILSSVCHTRYMYKKRSWTIEQLQDAVKTSLSYRRVLVKLKLRPTGGNYDQLKKYIAQYDLNISHFTGQAWNRGMKGMGKPHRTFDEILVKDSYFQSYKLKLRLLAAGLKSNLCEHCGWAERTIDGYTPLELDHINGDRHDNRLDNLRILCPNCHSLTPTYRGRGKRKK